MRRAIEVTQGRGGKESSFDERRTQVRLRITTPVGASALTLTLAACGGSGGRVSTATGHPSQQPSASPTPNIAQISNQLVSAINKMINADNANLAAFNSSTPATATAGINATIADHQALDSTLQGIAVPASDQSDVSNLLKADAAYENALATLAVNTDSVANYNSVFNTVVPLQSAFQAALSAVGTDFGITFNASPTP